LGLLLDRLHAAEQQRGSLVLVAGEPGIGKTRLAEELASAAKAEGVTAVRGRCSESDGAPAFWPWIQALRTFPGSQSVAKLQVNFESQVSSMAQTLADELPETPGSTAPPILGPEEARFRLFDTLTTFLKGAARRKPIVLILDDLHFADLASLRLLQFLTPEIRETGLMVMGNYRDSEVDRHHPLARVVAALVAGPHVLRVQLQGLPEHDVAEFIRRIVGEKLASPDFAAIFEQSEGNPFFVSELVRLRTAGGNNVQLSITDGVRAVINRRLDRLSTPCNRLLTFAAVLGRNFALGALESAVGLPLDRLLELLSSAEQARVIEPAASAPGRYRFTHALIRDTLYDQLTTGLRAQLHGRAGEALEKLYATDIDEHLSELAYHFLQAAPAERTERAVSYAVRAAQRAAEQLAYEESVRHYQLALRAVEIRTTVDTRRRCELLLDLGDAQNRAGDREDAKATFVRAADLARRLGSAEHLARAALGRGGTMLTAGLVDDVLMELLEEALRSLPAEDSPVRARLLSRLAMELYFTPAYERRAALSEQAVGMARRLDDLPALATALFSRHLALWDPWNVKQRLSVATEILQLATDTANPELTLQGHRWRMPDLLELGEVVAAWSDLDAHAQLAHALRRPFYVWDAVRWQAMRALLEGRFTQAEQLSKQADELGERVLPGTSRTYRVCHLFVLRSDQGRVGELESALDDLVATLPSIPSWRCWRAELYVELGRDIEARRELELLARDDFAALPYDLMWLPACSVLAQACAALRDIPRAEVLYRLLLPFASRNGVVGSAVVCYGSVAHYLGLLASSMARWNVAEQHFTAALAANTRLGAVPLVAHTQHAYTRLLLSRGANSDVIRARALASQALETAQALGMQRLAEQLQAIEPAVVAKTGVQSADPLSERELQVLRLVAAGKTNREIAAALDISLNTVLRHVSNILGKTNSSNRAEAATYAARHGLLDSTPERSRRRQRITG
jgi:DNA-binding NarL/FixJ family response regulator